MKVFIDQDLKVCPELGLKWTIALVCLLGDGGRIRNAGIEEGPVKTLVMFWNIAEFNFSAFGIHHVFGSITKEPRKEFAWHVG
jgi:hypothetical protein